MDNITYTVPRELAGKTLGSVLKSSMGLSRRIIINLKYSGRVTVNGTVSHMNAILKSGDIISLDIYDGEINIQPEDIPINIIHEDDAVLVVNKPGDLVVHPTSGHPSGTLANAVSFYFVQKGLNIKVRPVNRLDRGTSGIIVFAKDQYSHNYLSKQLIDKTMHKEYIGIVSGTFNPLSGCISMPIARKPGSIMEREVSENGDRAVTFYETLNTSKDYSLVRFVLETGRTHQIRVHCLASDHPLIGDSLYGNTGLNLINRQALHAYKIGFNSPEDGIHNEYTAPLPDDMRKLANALFQQDISL